MHIVYNVQSECIAWLYLSNCQNLCLWEIQHWGYSIILVLWKSSETRWSFSIHFQWSNQHEEWNLCSSMNSSPIHGTLHFLLMVTIIWPWRSMIWFLHRPEMRGYPHCWILHAQMGRGQVEYCGRQPITWLPVIKCCIFQCWPMITTTICPFTGTLYSSHSQLKAIPS